MAHSELVSLSWLAILFIIISLAVTGLEQGDPLLLELGIPDSTYKDIRALARKYREAAMRCIAKEGVFWGRHNVHSLQALILLGYSMYHSEGNTWVLLGEL